MSSLSGYDSETVGFESVTLNKRTETSSSTQTTDFSEVGAESQTNMSVNCGLSVTPEDLSAQDDILREYPPPGLTEFLRKVVPTMLEQLDQTDNDVYYSSDSDGEESINAKLIQSITFSEQGSGDNALSVLDISWSSAGNSLAVSLGKTHHEDWCSHSGLIKIYTIKQSANNMLQHDFDINEKTCITVVKYHPSVAALLAYGTTSGEVVLCNLRNPVEDMQLTSPAGCHGSRRVSSLQWADSSLANKFLTIQINNKRKRRGASDQILASAGSDGSLNVWQVNGNSKVFESVVSYSVNGSRKLAAPDISCFDFIKSYPLRPAEERVPDDIFVVGTTSGKLYLCKIKAPEGIENNLLDPVYEEFECHATCILNISFSRNKPGIFLSVSIDSELRIYDVNQLSPIKVLCLDYPVSCMSWLPSNQSVVIIGLAKPEGQSLKLFNVANGKSLNVEGLVGDGESITAVTVKESGTCRIASGDMGGSVHVWEVPTRRMPYTVKDSIF